VVDRLEAQPACCVRHSRGSANKESITMSDVLDFELPTQPAEWPKSKFGNDEWLLKLCAEWRAARAQQQKNWAEHKAATMWGTLPDDHSPELDLSPLERVKEIENLLAEIGKPQTMLLARELLGVCVTILAHAYEDRESAFAQGPVLEILRNVLDSFQWCEADMQIGPETL